MARGFDAMATGHYARVEQDVKTGRWLLKKALDDKKIKPTSFTVDAAGACACAFPVRGSAAAGSARDCIPVWSYNAHKPDSQDICFVPDGDYAAFIRQDTGLTFPQGRFIDADGNTLGTHQGMIHYTVGQRKGLGIAFGRPMYVLAKNAQENTVMLGPDEALFSREMLVERLNFISIEALSAPLHVRAKTRYRHAAQPATLYPAGENCIRVIFRRASAGNHAWASGGFLRR